VRKTVFGLMIIVLFCVGGFAQKEQDCLKVDASISPRYLSRGQEGKVVLKIKLAEGITIDPQPSFIIECDPSSVSLEAKRGNHSFEGRIKYFAFSKQEGWCLKSTAKFAASFYTRSTRIKKK